MSFGQSVRRKLVKGLQITGMNVAASSLYYNFLHGFKSASPGLDDGFERIFEYVEERKLLSRGELYCEFGLFKGYSFWKAQDLVTRRGNRQTEFWGFDSFEGLPAVTEIDVTSHGEFREGQYSCSLDKVKGNLDKAGVDWARTHLIKGFFRDSLTPDLRAKLRGKQIGIAMIDCDLYEATVEVLDWIEDLVAPEAVLIMDDWNCFGSDNNRGQRRALREFMERNANRSLEPIATYGLNSAAFLLRSPSKSH